MPAKLTPKYAEAVIERLGRIPEDATPAWGKMNRAQLYGHLHAVMRYSEGKLGRMPDKSTPVRRLVFRPLILNGLSKIPRNIRIPGERGRTEAPPEATLDEVAVAIRAAEAALSSGDAKTPNHPFFGEIGPRGWLKFHYRHCEHHLEQFGV